MSSLEDIEKTFRIFGVALQDLPDIRPTSLDISTRFVLNWNPIEQLDMEIEGATALVEQGYGLELLLVSKTKIEALPQGASARGQILKDLVYMHENYPILLLIKILRHEIDFEPFLRYPLLLYYLSEIYGRRMGIKVVRDHFGKFNIDAPGRSFAVFDNSLAAKCIYVGKIGYLPGEPIPEMHKKVRRFLHGPDAPMLRYESWEDLKTVTYNPEEFEKLLFFGRPTYYHASPGLSQGQYPELVISGAQGTAREKAIYIVQNTPNNFTIADFRVIASRMSAGVFPHVENEVMARVTQSKEITISDVFWLMVVDADLDAFQSFGLVFEAFRITPGKEEKEIKEIFPVLMKLESLYAEYLSKQPKVNTTAEFPSNLRFGARYSIADFVAALAEDWRDIVLSMYSIDDEDLHLTLFGRKLYVETAYDLLFLIWYHTMDSYRSEDEYFVGWDGEPPDPWKPRLSLQYTERGEILGHLIQHEEDLNDDQRRMLIQFSEDSRNRSRTMFLAKKYRYDDLLVNNLASITSASDTLSEARKLISLGVNLNDPELWDYVEYGSSYVIIPADD